MSSQLHLPFEQEATDIDRLNWDFAGANTQYSTHGLHTYLAAMIPQIPKMLLKMYANESSRILDPFVGGGSVTTEAYLNGFSATGIDINTLAALISRVKATPISEQSLSLISKNFHAVYIETAPKVPSFTDRSKISYWFKDYMFEPLSKLRRTIDQSISLIDEHERTNILRLLQCVYSNTVRSVSLTYRNEIRLRRLEKPDYEGFNPDIYGEFSKRLKDTIKRVSQLPKNEAQITIAEGDARALALADNSHDLVITSPPYGDLRNTM